jgi:glycosyltransferase involved in cell wall biosynthesis
MHPTWTEPRTDVEGAGVPSRRARPRIVLVSTYPPRQCGIATFTHDLFDAMREIAPDLETGICAVERDDIPHLAPEVAFILRQDEYEDYAKTAAEIADSGVAAVVIEHEFGIYGGPDGAWIIRFAEELHARGVPYLVTLHTLLSHPSRAQSAILHQLCRRAFAVSVFTETARRLAIRTGVAAPDRIVVVPHGAPVVLHADPAVLLRHPAFAGQIRREVATLLIESRGKRLVSTFGLISPGKGLETALSAVAAAAVEHPEVCYVIAGATHPEVLKRHGDHYRRGLTALVAGLGIAENVRFLDFFLTDVEIALLLGRTEVFLTPYRSRDQISSGALTFALSAGCAVVSTDYHYARDMLAGGAGELVDPDDVPGFGDALRTMLGDPARLAGARQAARQLGASLDWPSVGHRFAEVLREAALSHESSWPATALPRPRPSRGFATVGVGIGG